MFGAEPYYSFALLQIKSPSEGTALASLKQHSRVFVGKPDSGHEGILRAGSVNFDLAYFVDVCFLDQDRSPLSKHAHMRVQAGMSAILENRIEAKVPILLIRFPHKASHRIIEPVQLRKVQVLATQLIRVNQLLSHSYL